MNKGVLALGVVVTAPLLALLLLNIGRNPSAIASPLIQKPAPDVRLKNLEGGGSLQMSSLRGKPVVVNFWATWCIPCVQEHAALTRAARANPDVAFLGVVYEDTTENALSFLAQRGSAYSSYADDDANAAIAFGVYGVPETFFINPQGTIIEKYVGPLDDGLIRERLVAVRK